MESLVYKGSMSVLINASAKNDFVVAERVEER